MQGFCNVGRLARVLRDRSSILFNPEQFHAIGVSCFSLQWRSSHTNLVSSSCSALYGNPMQMESKCQRVVSSLKCHVSQRSSYSSKAIDVGSGSTETVKEIYEKILKSIVDQKTAPPNAYLWSLIAKCANEDDIKLLFDILQRLRIFRLSNLRIHENFNCALCQEVTKACIRVGAITFGQKALYKHNLYGLTPNVGSAHHLLMFAKKHNDVDLMVDIMKLVSKNELPLQPGTADLVFSICYHNDNWELMCKYGKMFVKGGARLRQGSFDLWMEFAAKMGDVDSLWKIEKIRSESMNHHTISSAFSCAKALLIESKSEEAAAIIQVFYENLPVSKRQNITAELQKLVNEWPVEVIKRQKEESRKELARTLQNGISTMIDALSSIGAKMDVNVERVTIGV
ncbi:unnamed protein product [Cuscuta campestris]|uniref:Uncharacterized protein n=2 Tax=Cuscuta sect. Cleistogrammica TaxID=1824901 RepID=A0A484KR10_9ASTE|nr:hypothetical protein DM860_005517 [Cuscuta australis]VFQ68163.1 unnamed protein product [Cuscuta campestris]